MHRTTGQWPLLDRDTLVAIVSHMTEGGRRVAVDVAWKQEMSGFGNYSTRPGERVLFQR